MSILPYIKLYPDFIDIARELDNGARGQLFLAVLEYANGEEVSTLTGVAKIAFLTIKSQIDRDRNTYLEISEKRKIAGKRGAEERWQKEEIIANAILPMANDGKNGKCHQEEDKEEDKDKDKDKDKDDKARSRFTPPTVEEVQAYCQARGNRIDAQRFVDFYTANGWVQGKGKPIKDWKACVRTWEQRDGGKVKGDDYSSVFSGQKAKSQENPDEVFAAYPDLKVRYAGYCQECAQNGQESMSASEFLALQKPSWKAGGEYAEVY